MSLVRLRQIIYDQTNDLLKDIKNKSLSGTLGETAIEQLAAATRILERGASSVDMALDKFVTCDPFMLKVKARIKLLASHHEPVLIIGPTGTGKELLAKALKIPGAPFVAENCAGIPENLVESIFFGHKRGAFTGAIEDKVGLLEKAEDGIIFLDEVGDLPMTLQAKFLRAIQENEIRRVGDVDAIKISCRFVAATKYDLEDRVTKHLFREDLYARLFTYTIRVTGLKDRPGDIPLITKSKMENPEAYDKLPPFPESVIRDIEKYNVRAIEAALARHNAYESYD